MVCGYSDASPSKVAMGRWGGGESDIVQGQQRWPGCLFNFLFIT